MRTDERSRRHDGHLADVRCTAMACTALSALVGSFWMIGLLF